MKKHLLAIALLFSLCSPSLLNAQRSTNNLPTEKLNPQIQKIVSEISAKNIEASIRKLVSIGTRHSLSETESETRGIGAARRWIKCEMQRYATESGGSLQ